MSKLTPLFKISTLAALVLTIGLIALPAAGVSAADLQSVTPPSADQPSINGRLERIWAHAQNVYQRQDHRLAIADVFLTKAQSLIDKANQKGWDTSAVQAALDAFASFIPAAQAAHNPGAAIIAGHNGFSTDGKVIDRAAAIESTKALVQVIKNTRAAMNGTGQALREAVKAFRETHRPALAPVTP